MKKLLVFFLSLHIARAQKAEDINIVTSKEGNNNIYMTTLMCKEIKISVKKSPEKLNDFNNNVIALSKSVEQDQKALFDKISKSAQDRMTEHKIGAAVLDLYGDIIKISTSPAPVFGKIVDKSITKFNEYVIGESLSQVKRDLEIRLGQYSKTHTDEEIKALKKTVNPQEFLKKLDEGLAPIEKDILKDVPEEERIVVNSFYNRQATVILKAGVEKLTIDQIQNEEEIKEIKSNIKGLSRAVFHEFTKTQQAMGEIVATQNTIIEDVNILKKDFDDFKDEIKDFKQETARNFDFIHEFMFSRMNTSERLTAVQNGLIGKNWNKEQRAKEEKKLIILKNQQLIQEKAEQILNYGDNVLALAGKFGVSSKITEPAKKAIVIGSAANNAFKAFSSGNYLAMAGAVASLFGMGGPNVEQERHNEIMQSFKQVMEQLGVVDQKLDAILQTQDQILKNQQKLYESIISLGQQVAKNHAEVMDKLREIHGDLLINRELIIRQPMAEYASCETILPILKQETNPIISTEKGIIPTFERFDEFWSNKNGHIAACKNRFETIFELSIATGTVSNEFGSLFRAETHKKKSELEFSILIDSIYNTSFNMLKLKEYSPFKLDFKSNSFSTFRPVFHFDNIKNKLENIKENGSLYPDNEILKSYLLEPNIISLHINFLLNFHVIYMILNPKKIIFLLIMKIF